MKRITELNDDCVWHVTAPGAPLLEPLDEDVYADYAIVGAGYTGLVTALRLAERGHDAAVVEAKQVGFGASGRNLGHCTPTFHFWSFDKIKRLYGADYAERIIRMQTASADQVFSLIEQYQMQCEAVRNGYLRVAARPRHLENFKEFRDLYARYGLKSRLLDAGEVEELSGSPRFHGGWLLEGAGHINPLGYARGLARAALSRGARIYTGSPVESVKREGRLWRIRTPGGSMRAGKVLIATGAYTIGPPWSKLDTAYFKVPVAGLATRPLDSVHKERILKHNHSLTSTHDDPVFFRWAKDNRLVTSVRSSGAMGNDPELTRAIMTEKTRSIFPDLEGVEWDHYWFGLLDGQYRTVPRIFRLDENVFTCLGYSGRGVPSATAAGSVLADLLEGRPPESLSLPVENFKRVMPGLGLMHRAYAAWSRLNDRVRFRLDGHRKPPTEN